MHLRVARNAGVQVFADDGEPDICTSVQIPAAAGGKWFGRDMTGVRADSSAEQES